MSRPAVEKFGRYELLTELARGGMAELYLGRLLGVAGFAKLVAIKRILPHISQDKQFVDMFLNEGRIAARLSHPNVCQVYELGEEDGQLYLAMEYLEGAAWETLAALLPDDRGDRARIIAGVIAQGCDGLHYAHELRDVTGEATPVIHRDVSPQNLFVTIDGVCKVLDFGVSKMMTEGSRTRSGVIKGKLPYMSPEQIAGDPIDARADVFSTGIVLWEAFTGKHLFHRSTDYQIWNAVMSDPVPPAGAGGGLDAVVARALERDRERRYPSCAALAHELRRAALAYGGAASNQEIAAGVRERCADHLTARAREVASAIGALRQREPSAADTLEEAGATQSMQLRSDPVVVTRARARWPLALVVVGLVIAAGAGTWAAFGRAQGGVTVAAADARAPDAGVMVASTAVDARPADAGAPPIDAAIVHHRTRPTPHRGSASAVAVETAQAPGTLTVDSRPFARIYIDGAPPAGKEGETPAYKIAVPAGRHKLRLVLEDHRERTLDVEVKPGADVNLGTITWPSASP